MRFDRLGVEHSLGVFWLTGYAGGLLNFAYHPSCAWDPQWQWPLAPVGNHLAVAVAAGERIDRMTNRK